MAAGGPTAAAGEHHGRPRPKVGYAYVHSAIDGYTRLAYSEVLDNEQGATAADFWRRAGGSSPTTASPSNGSSPTMARCYRSNEFAHALERRTAHLHPALPAPDQWQGRAVQPHPARRMGLRPDLDLRRPTQSTTCPLAPHLQPSPTPHRHRRPTGEPCRQPVRALHLDVPARTGAPGARRRTARRASPSEPGLFSVA